MYSSFRNEKKLILNYLVSYDFIRMISHLLYYR